MNSGSIVRGNVSDFASHVLEEKIKLPDVYRITFSTFLSTFELFLTDAF